MTNKFNMSDMLELRPEIDAAMKRANKTALLRHARLGESVCTWRDGKVVWIEPKEIFASYGLDEFGRDNTEIQTQPQDNSHAIQ